MDSWFTYNGKYPGLRDIGGEIAEDAGRAVKGAKKLGRFIMEGTATERTGPQGGPTVQNAAPPAMPLAAGSAEDFNNEYWNRWGSLGSTSPNPITGKVESAPIAAGLQPTPERMKIAGEGFDAALRGEKIPSQSQSSEQGSGSRVRFLSEAIGRARAFGAGNAADNAARHNANIANMKMAYEGRDTVKLQDRADAWAKYNADLAAQNAPQETAANDLKPLMIDGKPVAGWGVDSGGKPFQFDKGTVGLSDSPLGEQAMADAGLGGQPAHGSPVARRKKPDGTVEYKDADGNTWTE